MDTHDIETLLVSHGVKPTSNRLLVARALSSCAAPVTLSDMEVLLPSVDKSNIFRALKIFQETHLVHAIEGAEGTLYELCLSHNHDHDEDTHVHFHCECCHRTICLPDVAIPSVPLPEGYLPSTANYIVKGLCPDCAARKS